MAEMRICPLQATEGQEYLRAQRSYTMTTEDYGKLDLEAIETRARRMRARYIADFFRRRDR